ncbi:thiol:disulfide interchange protein TlpA [Pseudohoeflea coraliihabitans]|uniref:Redoxin domain-containing protein n=1 Tax=Pseudohoeflea coraliihabitans TaxID=2860393 RepID=A0ABS6WKQ2_9HYPH|nr:redoxin domain-containing protein [Pseudohoeflea sp. DP4N28-3]MBW3096514.1 redoxin domain-containing protein [Pseudohoeflea sp. DP4N28-3]
MSSARSRHIPTPVLVAIAIVLGAAAGVWWVYGMGPPSGNGVAAPVVASDDSASCTGNDALSAALEPLARGEVAAMDIREPALTLPPLTFDDSAGERRSLDDFSGTPLLVNFWATWCAPCRAEMPALAQLQEEMGGDDFQVLAINIDTGDRSKPEAFLDEIGVSNLGLYRDATMDVFNILKKRGLAFGLPATLLVGADGCLLGVMNGPAEWASPDAKALIAQLKAGTPQS